MWRDISRRQWFARLLAAVFGSASAARWAAEHAAAAVREPNPAPGKPCTLCGCGARSRMTWTTYDGSPLASAHAGGPHTDVVTYDSSILLSRDSDMRWVSYSPDWESRPRPLGASSTFVFEPCRCPECGKRCIAMSVKEETSGKAEGAVIRYISREDW